MFWKHSEEVELRSSCLPATPEKGANPGCPGPVPAQELGAAYGCTLLLSRGNRPGTNMSKHQCVSGWKVAVPRQESYLHPESRASDRTGRSLAHKSTCQQREQKGSTQANSFRNVHQLPLGQALDPEHNSNAPASVIM